MLTSTFFARDAKELAKVLLGKIIRIKYQNYLLAAKIIETEAYYQNDKASHASLGYTEKRKALFMPSGTIYMYYARGGDSFNISAEGAGNAVLIKSAFPHIDATSPGKNLSTMQKLNPNTQNNIRSIEKLCAGQTLLCKSLGIKVKNWDTKQFVENDFYIEDTDYHPEEIIQCRRLGIPQGRDEDLLYRFVDAAYARHCTSNPLTKRSWQVNQDYHVIDWSG